MSSSSEPPSQPQNGSIKKVAEDPDQTKTITENASDVGRGRNTKEEEKDNKNNKTKGTDEKIKAIAEDISNTILPFRKVEKLEKLRPFGKAAERHLIKIGNESRSPLVKKKVLEIMSDINDQAEESGDA